MRISDWSSDVCSSDLLRIADMQQAPLVAQALRDVLPPYVHAQDWTQNNRTWFAAVQTEKRMMFLILALIVAVAAFNLLSSLVMDVKDTRSDIATLRTLGASQRKIASIFLVQGSLYGVVGRLLGVGCEIERAGWRGEGCEDGR